MNVKSLGLATAAGLATVLVVGVAVTEFALAWIEFSLFVGIPAGIAAGSFVAAAVYLGLADDAPVRRRRTARSMGSFGAAFLVVLVLATATGDLGVVYSLGIAVLVGGLVAAVAYRSA